MDYDAFDEIICRARTSTEDGDYHSAIVYYKEVIKEMESLSVTLSPPEKKKLLHVISLLDKEKQQIAREDRAVQELMDKFQNVDSPSDAPPADPDVWPAPPPRRSTSTNRKPINTNGKLTSVTKGRCSDGEDVIGKRPVKKSCSQSLLSDKKNKKASTNIDTSELHKAEGMNEEKKEDEFIPQGYCPELISAIEQTMSREGVHVAWDDIAGLDEPKKLFKQAIILPALMPNFFKGIRRPWRGVCMVGPPGTGKTLLAKAVATECQTTFFAVNCGDLASKWRGDSEKLVKLLFEMARHHAPSTIFIDEIDTIGSQRGQSNEHEASRRVKSQLLVEMDGFSKEQEGKRVLVLAATNFPWMLDEALRRRFEKRIYIPLPDKKARLALLNSALKEIKIADDVDLESIAERLNGFSGADVSNVCREAALMGVKRLTDSYSPAEIASMAQEDLDLPVTKQDFLDALRDTNPSVSEENLRQYTEWMEKYGSS